MAQRLIRKLCPACKVVDDHPNPQFLRLLNITPEDVKKNPIYKPVGCAKCNGRGFKGRLGVFEMMEMNSELRELAFARSTASELRRAARASGMRPLLEDGKIKIFKGITTPEEIAKISQAEGLVLD
jgi:type IV pilus assembly protein PilB